VSLWAVGQTRVDNLASFGRMSELWFPSRRGRGATYRFEKWQIELAQRVLAEQNKESK
jgi:hypothetical protein